MDSSRDKQKVAGVNFVKTRKSLKLDDLERLLDLLKGRVDVVSLQISPTTEEIDRIAAASAYQPDIRNFTDTAAIIALCDQVITIDTAAAHLAGAIGARAHVLLSKGADWRWSRESNGGSSWYPGTRLHRQKVEHGWESPIHSAVGGALSI